MTKEWGLLQSSLPEGIWVIASEATMDLFRAVVLGPAGTPYADIPFFFDIHLPSDYPTSPPAVSFFSYHHAMPSCSLFVSVCGCVDVHVPTC